ncbi:MAG: efflux transporter outer membrane subunit, partial [Piscinibacter sp.]|uniref:efflux transporter outer membrane subunit n=1 Tax=Piscinibacter sp. TaxID=1903157 RepID=UPI003D12BEF2
LAIARENLASQEETLRITQWRVQAGLATSLQSEQARAAVEQTRAQIPALQTTLALARHQLALLTGRTAAELRLAEGSAVPQPAADLALAFPADTLRQRPDVRAAEARVAAAAQRVLQADAARYPSFSLSGSLGLSALTLSGLGSGAVVSSLLAGVSMPLFDGGALRAQGEAQRAAFEQAREAHRGAVLAALKDVEDALVALQGDRERLARLRDAADAANNAALLARQRYASGLVDFQTVLETQRTQLGAQDSVAASQADVAGDHVRLYKALGGGWTPQAAPTENRS